MKGIVLSYHSHNVFGSGYENNDHVAFSRNLELITAAGGEIISLMSLVARIRRCQSGERSENDEKFYVALTFDDGPVFDYKDFIHPVHGYQRLAILQFVLLLNLKTPIHFSPVHINLSNVSVRFYFQ